MESSFQGYSFLESGAGGPRTEEKVRSRFERATNTETGCGGAQVAQRRRS